MCGVVGVYGVDNPLDTIEKLMFGLDHRGHQGAGMVLAGRDGSTATHKSDSYLPRIDLALRMTAQNIDGRNFFAGIGHLRYGTSGSLRSIDNTQPLQRETSWGEIYIGHNGDTPYFKEMKDNLFKSGMLFTTNSDSEMILNQIGLSKKTDPIEAIKHGLRAYKGTYALVMLIKENTTGEFKLIAARDSSGNRPLALGKLNGGYIVASENTAFEVVGGEFLREIQPNELLVISDQMIKIHYIDPMVVIDPTSRKFQHCIFENDYFSHPKSVVFNMRVGSFRNELGRRAARRFGDLLQEGDVLTNPPDSSNYFADGFCRELKIYTERVFDKRHGEPIRSFTQETDEARDLALRLKFSISGELVNGKRAWIIDDSVVRGKTARRLVLSLKSNGATFVGVISCFPPLIGPCHKGIDMGDVDINELIAVRHMKDNKLDIEAIKQEIEADFLGYLPFEDLKDAISALRQNPNNFCFGCLQNKEPIWGKW